MRYKYAEEEEEEEKKLGPGKRLGATALGTAGIGYAGAKANHFGNRPLQNRLEDEAIRQTDLGGVTTEDLMDQLDEKVVHRPASEVRRFGDTSYFGTGRKHTPTIADIYEEQGEHDEHYADIAEELRDADATIFSPFADEKGKDDLGVLAHELGHAKGSKDPSLLNRFTDQTYGLSKLLGVPVGGLGGALAATSKNKKVRKWAPAAAMAPLAPMLLEEGRANLNADKILRDAGVEGDDLWKARKGLGKSFLSYASLAGGMGAGAYGLRKLMDKYYEDDDEEEGQQAA